MDVRPNEDQHLLRQRDSFGVGSYCLLTQQVSQNKQT
jgi:hypothetical protein